MIDIKIYGERNTGTIYLEWLLSNNLNINLLNDFNLGWKHRLAPEQDEITDELNNNTIFVSIVKNPYSWMYSMHKRPYKHEKLAKLDFQDFIRYSYGDYKNPAVLWNKKYESYLKLKSYVKYFYIFKYEKLLKDPKPDLDEFANKFNLQKSGLWFVNITQTLTNHHGIKNQQFKKDFYLNEDYMRKYSYSDIDFVNKNLDTNLLKEFGYKLQVFNDSSE